MSLQLSYHHASKRRCKNPNASGHGCHLTNVRCRRIEACGAPGCPLNRPVLKLGRAVLKLGCPLNRPVLVPTFNRPVLL